MESRHICGFWVPAKPNLQGCTIRTEEGKSPGITAGALRCASGTVRRPRRRQAIGRMLHLDASSRSGTKIAGSHVDLGDGITCSGDTAQGIERLTWIRDLPHGPGAQYRVP